MPPVLKMPASRRRRPVERMYPASLGLERPMVWAVLCGGGCGEDSLVPPFPTPAPVRSHAPTACPHRTSNVNNFLNLQTSGHTS